MSTFWTVVISIIIIIIVVVILLTRKKQWRKEQRAHEPKTTAPHHCLVVERGPGPLPVRLKGKMYILALSDGTRSAANSVPEIGLVVALSAAIEVLREKPTAQLQVAPSFDLRMANLAVERSERLGIPESMRPRIKGVQF